MTRFEYKVVPAPERGKRAKGIKGGPARFAFALEDVMNAMAAQGWEYQRTDTLPCEERVGLTGKTTVFQNMLVFRRAQPAEAVPEPEVTALLAAPVAKQPDPAPEEPPAAKALRPEPAPEPTPEPRKTKADTAVQDSPARDKTSAAAAAAAALRARRDSAQAPEQSGVAAE